MDEVDVDPVDLGDEVGKSRERLLESAPVVIGRPVVGERLDRLEMHTLGRVELTVRPSCRADAVAQVLELLVGDVDGERSDVRSCGGVSRSHLWCSYSSGSLTVWRNRSPSTPANLPRSLRVPEGDTG